MECDDDDDDDDDDEDEDDDEAEEDEEYDDECDDDDDDDDADDDDDDDDEDDDEDDELPCLSRLDELWDVDAFERRKGRSPKRKTKTVNHPNRKTLNKNNGTRSRLMMMMLMMQHINNTIAVVARHVTRIVTVRIVSTCVQQHLQT